MYFPELLICINCKCTAVLLPNQFFPFSSLPISNISVSLYLSVCVPACLVTYLPPYLPTCLSVSVCLSVCLLLRSQLYVWGSYFFGEIFCVWDLFSIHRGSHIPSSRMVRAGCGFVADIHSSRTWMSGSRTWMSDTRLGHECQNVRAVTCMCAQNICRFIFSTKRGLRNGVKTHVNSKGKIPSTGKLWGSNPRYWITHNTLPAELLSKLTT